MSKNQFAEKRIKRQRRAARIRAKIFGTAKSPRLSVFRSGRHIYAQLINDEKSKTLLSASDLELKKEKGKRIDSARAVGKLIAQKAREAKITAAIFDKGGFKYHGRVKALAEGAREGGLKF